MKPHSQSSKQQKKKNKVVHFRINRLSRSISKNSRTKTWKAFNLKNLVSNIQALSKTIMEDSKRNQELISRDNWSSRPLSEYVVPGPIPDLDFLITDAIPLRNFFDDIQEIDD